MRFARLLTVLPLLAGCASSDSAPPPSRDAVREALDPVRERFGDASAVTVEVVATVGGGARSFVRTTWADPGLYREERWDGEAPVGEPASLEVFDGTTSWLYFPAEKKYYERAIQPADLDRKPFLLGFTRDGKLAVEGIEAGREEELVFAAGCLCMPIPGGGKLEAGPDADVGGRACRTVTYTVGRIVETFYVAKDDAAPVRFTLESSFEHDGKTFRTTAESDLKRTEKVLRLETTGRPNPGLFRFTPPDGASPASRPGEEKLLAIGAGAPELGAVDASGNPVRLADYRGKVVLLNFWFLG